MTTLLHWLMLALGAMPGGDSIEIAQVSRAENSLVTDSGRVFVTGADNVYEIVRSGDGYSKIGLTDGGIEFTGLCRSGEYLYVLSFDGTDVHLWGGRYQPQIELRRLHRLRSVRLGNGLAADANGDLFVTDFPLGRFILWPGKVVKLHLAPDRVTVREEETWLNWWNGLFQPNGVKIIGETLYLTDLAIPFVAKLKRVPIQPDGTPGRVSTVFHRWLSLFDDFVSLDDDRLTFAIGDYARGRVVFVRPSARDPFLGETPRLFESASSVAVGDGITLSAGTLLVTDRGAGTVSLIPVPSFAAARERATP